VHRNRWEVALSEELVKLGSTNGTLDEDDDLIELKLVEEFVELSVLLTLVELDIVLLETM